VARFGALLAVAKKLNASSGDVEAVLTGQPLMHRCAVTAVELDDLSATQANHVLVLIRLGLISRVVSGEVKFTYQIEFL
jgi:hypothetical protein